MEPDVILREARSRANDARAIERTVDSEEFKAAWRLATEDQRDELLALVRGIEKVKLDMLVANIAKADPKYMSLADLREKARNMGIPFYHHKSKAELIAALCKTS